MKGRVEAPPNPILNMKINVRLKYGNEQHSFGITERCPVSRFYTVVESGFGIKIERILYYQDKMLTKSIEIDNKTKWLLEDYNIQEGHTIEVFGPKTPNNPSRMIGVEVMVEWSVRFDGKATEINATKVFKFPFLITKHCTVANFLTEIKLSVQDVIPDTIDLTFKGQKICSNLNAFMLKDLGIQKGDTIEMTGKFFPLSLLGGRVNYTNTMGIHIAPECLVCLEKTPTVPFDCGHVNVCSDCVKKQPICPICKKI